jgi:DNA-binding LytR/AlgR family response regulator
MKLINCIIIDDEPFALDQVEEYVRKTPFLSLKGRCESAFEALEIINTSPIDLIFADIQMPGLNGIDFGKTIDKSTKIIFTTAFKDYAIEGYKVNAIDYLLKPFNYQEFLKGATKAYELIGLEGKHKLTSPDYIFVKSEYRQIKISLNEVYYFEGLGDYVKIWLNTAAKPVISLMSLKSLENELPSNNFMRVHRSFIVALNKIESIERSKVIINKRQINIADQYKVRFQSFIEDRTLT